MGQSRQMAEAEAAEVREQMVHKFGVRLRSPVHSRGYFRLGQEGQGGRLIEYLLKSEQGQICTWDNAIYTYARATVILLNRVYIYSSERQSMPRPLFSRLPEALIFVLTFLSNHGNVSYQTCKSWHTLCDLSVVNNSHH